MLGLRASLVIFITGLLSITWLTANAAEETVTTQVVETPSTVSAPATTTTTTERHVIVTPVPAAKETIVTPQGYINCFTVDAGWFRDVWIPSHRVCQYENTGEGVAWVEGYWACTKYNVD